MSRYPSVVLFALACAVSVSLFNTRGTIDVFKWKIWTDHAERLGVRAGYVANKDNYPPLGNVVLASIPRLTTHLGVKKSTAFKLTLLTCLLATSVAFGLWTRSALMAAAMQLALVLNCMGLAYTDIYFAPWLVIALWALQRERLALFAVCFSISALTKWQPLIIAPFILAHLVKATRVRDLPQAQWRMIVLRVGVPGLAILGACVAVFGTEVFRAFGQALSHDYLSGNALNFNWILTYTLHRFAPTTFGAAAGGVTDYIRTRDPRIVLAPKLLFWVCYVALLARFFRGERTFRRFLFYSLAGYLAYFTFNIGVHENHLFMPCILALALMHEDRSALPTALTVVVLANVNLFIFYGIAGEGPGFSRNVGVDVTLIFAIVYVLFFGGLFWAALHEHDQKRAPSA